METMQGGSRSRKSKGGLVDVEFKNNADLAKIEKKLEKTKFKSLDHVARYMRKAVLNRFAKGTRRKKDGKRVPSAPGRPPKYWPDNYRSVVYGSGGTRKSKYIGHTPVRFDRFGKASTTLYASPERAGDRVFQMLEEGGSQYIEIWKDTDVVADRRYRRDQQPGWRENHYKSFEERERTSRDWDEERKAIKEYYSNVKKREKVKVKVHAKYQARPFMIPTIRKIVSKLPKIVRDNFHTYFR